MTVERTQTSAGASRPARLRRGGAWWRPVGGLLLCAALAWLATGVYSVRSNERAVVRRCGRALRRVRTPGLHLGLPYGIDRVDRLRALETKRVGVGMGLADRAIGRRAAPQQAECLTGDRNLLLVSAVVQYRISHPRAYLLNVADVPALVRSVAAAELSRTIAGMTVDDVLTVRRGEIQKAVRDATQAALDRYGAGVTLTERVLLSSEGVAPPVEVAEAFRDVTSAREDRQRAINVAQAYANRLAPETRGQGYRVTSEAEAYADEVVEKARGDRDRFLAEAAQLGRAREVTFKRLLLETLEEVLPRLRKVVVGAGTGDALDLGIIESTE